MRTITREEALHALNEAVAMKGPNYVDAYAARGDTCRNVVKDKDGVWVPSCIVGTALVWLGVPAEWFADSQCLAVTATTATTRLRNAGLMDFAEEAVELLSQAQGKQDQKHSWGEAVAYAALGFDWFYSLEPRFDEPKA